MKITIESTNRKTFVNGNEVRVWNGMTEGGMPCIVFVSMLAAIDGRDTPEFEAELTELPLPLELVDLWKVL
jgi:hypothetical protein